MRLGQLARKLSIRQSEVVSFLKQQNILVEENSNARIDDAHTAMVIHHYAPHLAVQQIEEVLNQESTTLEEETSAEPTPGESLIEETGEKGQPFAEPSAIIAATPSEQLDVEVIKAPKVELPGLKVVGKIELPQPKKKEEPAPAETPEVTIEPNPAEVSPPRKERRDRRGSRDRRQQQNQPRKNPVALQREREAREALKKKLAEEESRKERKASHYQKKVKPQGPTKAARIHNEEFEQLHEVKEEPKTFWGKFKKWFWRDY
jgi:hypothetical protein